MNPAPSKGIQSFWKSEEMEHVKLSLNKKEGAG
jgi:hypothetical protein